MDATRKLAKLIIKDPLTKELRIQVELTKTVGKFWHAADCNYGRYDEHEDVIRPPRLEWAHKLKITDTCPDCIYEEVGNKSPLLVSIIMAEDYLKDLGDISKMGEYGNFGIISDNIAYDHEKFSKLLKEDATPLASMVSRIERLRERQEGAGKAIAAAIRGETARKTLKETIERALISKEWLGKVELESEMILIGLTKGDYSSNRDQEIIFAIDSYLLFENDKSLVCYAPRYVHSYFIFAKSRGYFQPQTLITSALDPGSEEDRYAAARLWDPYGYGPLATLSAAAASALAI